MNGHRVCSSLASPAACAVDLVVPLLVRVRSVIASYSGGDPKRHAIRLLRAVAQDPQTELLATTAVATSCGAEATARHTSLGDRELMLRALDRAIESCSSPKAA